jgi:hypothetical protein
MCIFCLFSIQFHELFDPCILLSMQIIDCTFLNGKHHKISLNKMELIVEYLIVLLKDKNMELEYFLSA